MVDIVNYGMGNIRSVENALRYLGHESRVIDSPEQVSKSAKLILPGVGSFRAAMENIRRLGLFEPLDEAVRGKKTPILGICLGMQLLAEHGEEDGPSEGLGWIRGAVLRFPEASLSIKVPHIGFNTAHFETRRNGLFSGLKERADFYFVHSYRLVCEDAGLVSSWANYGERFAASVQNGNIFGTQFHPEKSQFNGLQVLKNFCEWKAI